MKIKPFLMCCVLVLTIHLPLTAQDYFFGKFHPFSSQIESPESFLGYSIGEFHTRHDLIVYYLKNLDRQSKRAKLIEYGRTHEGRKLVVLAISSEKNLENLEEIHQAHMKRIKPEHQITSDDLDVPLIVNLGYNVHGNEPSSSEAALLTAYTLVASNHPEIEKYRNDMVVFIDPTINPDGRDRHTQYANSYRANSLVADPQDAEHNEYWPRGRTNHYWFDLNRDWLLAIHPESRGKLDWYHNWYPNVVTDFHEMGSQSTYFFEPMKDNGSKDPIMPKENYIDLNNAFGELFAEALDSIGSLYFTKEVFDGTYPGYGSSYPDLQGGLGILFEQASSRGHKQTTAYGEITFAFTIRNQYTSSITTLKAALAQKEVLIRYQNSFFKSALSNAEKDAIKAYYFEDRHDKNRVKSFIDKLLKHRVKLYKSGEGYVVPTGQNQYRMVQTAFETYKTFRDSVFYDASAWSFANFYNMKYQGVKKFTQGDEIKSINQLDRKISFKPSSYAYLIDYNDYNAVALLHRLQQKGIVVASSFKPFQTMTNGEQKSFDNGTLVVSVANQKRSKDEIYTELQNAASALQVPVYSVNTGYHISGIDLGSRYVQPLRTPKVAMLIGDGTSSYEAGEVWHLLDTRVHMPITKIPQRNFSRSDLSKYNTLVMVSGSYPNTKEFKAKLDNWISQGNTLITIARASEWAVNSKVVDETLTSYKDETAKSRKSYIDAYENNGKKAVGGAIFEVALDLTHPLSFGYRNEKIPVYKNNTVWLQPSKNSYATVAKYTEDAHIDGFISQENYEHNLIPSASLITSKKGRGRVVLFADNPNFRGSWYGTNRLFLNALFLGNLIQIPNDK
ncbi:MAG: zinc carboxypeptidase [Flavobacteriaceae bacterium]|nr:zinc carboxypeptidase [Flavobacteriaceae bacterium]